MQTTTFLAIITAMASAAVASPASPAISKRDYATGQCGIHIYQTQRTNDDDWVEWVIKDANGDQIGHWTGVSLPGWTLS